MTLRHTRPELVLNKLTSIRGAFHTILIGALVTLTIAVTQGAASSKLLIYWLLAYVLLGAAVESGLRHLQARSARVVTAADYEGVVRLVGDSDALINSADSIDILSGTLKTFTERTEDIRALHDRHRANTRVRILVLDPGEEGARVMAEERRARGTTTSLETIDQQIISSLRCLAEEFPTAALEQIVRLYPTTRRTSVHRYGDRYVVTVYTFGRGGSSPAFSLRRAEHKAFCDGLDRGFDDLWNAETTRPLDATRLSELGIV